MITLLKTHFSLRELRSVVITFLAVFLGILAIEARESFQVVAAGNFSEEALMALFMAVGRSVVKALWNSASLLASRISNKMKAEKVENGEEVESKDI